VIDLINFVLIDNLCKFDNSKCIQNIVNTNTNTNTTITDNTITDNTITDNKE
jgi:hypothetical protein